RFIQERRAPATSTLDLFGRTDTCEGFPIFRVEIMALRQAPTTLDTLSAGLRMVSTIQHVYLRKCFSFAQRCGHLGQQTRFTNSLCSRATLQEPPPQSKTMVKSWEFPASATKPLAVIPQSMPCFGRMAKWLISETLALNF